MLAQTLQFYCNYHVSLQACSEIRVAIDTVIINKTKKKTRKHSNCVYLNIILSFLLLFRKKSDFFTIVVPFTKKFKNTKLRDFSWQLFVNLMWLTAWMGNESNFDWISWKCSSNNQDCLFILIVQLKMLKHIKTCVPLTRAIDITNKLFCVHRIVNIWLFNS